VDVLSHGFMISDNPNDGTGPSLTGIHLVGGDWDFIEKKLIPPNAQTSAVTRLPTSLRVSVQTGGKLLHTFIYAMYRYMPSDEFMTHGGETHLDSGFRNLRRMVPLETGRVERQLVSTGVAPVYHVPGNS